MAEHRAGFFDRLISALPEGDPFHALALRWRDAVDAYRVESEEDGPDADPRCDARHATLWEVQDAIIATPAASAAAVAMKVWIGRQMFIETLNPWDPELDDYDLQEGNNGIPALGAALRDLEALARRDAADRAAVVALGD